MKYFLTTKFEGEIFSEQISSGPFLGRVHNLPRGGAMVILRGGHHFLTLQ